MKMNLHRSKLQFFEVDEISMWLEHDYIGTAPEWGRAKGGYLKFLQIWIFSPFLVSFWLKTFNVHKTEGG